MLYLLQCSTDKSYYIFDPVEERQHSYWSDTIRMAINDYSTMRAESDDPKYSNLDEFLDDYEAILIHTCENWSDLDKLHETHPEFFI